MKRLWKIKMADILLKDWGRRFNNTGYGQLSRSIAHSISQSTRHNLFFSSSDIGQYSAGIPRQDILESFPAIPEASIEYDLMLCVCPPSKLPETCRPIVLFTQNALGGLISSWQVYISSAEAVIVPGHFDQEVFSRHHDHVDICPQVVDYDFFKPYPRYRIEGPDRLSFLFVGSFSYRKGADMVSDIFSTAQRDYGLPECEVHLHCFSGLGGESPSLLIDMGRQLPDNIKLTATSGSLSMPWMRRKMNRYDIAFTFSRGEGWCMPLWEALYSGIPVVAPNSTAMGEYLPEKGVRLFDVREKRILDVDSDFGTGFRKQYGETDVTMFEPDIDSAASTISNAANDLGELKREAIDNRYALSRKFSYEVMGRALSDTIEDVLGRKS